MRFVATTPDGRTHRVEVEALGSGYRVTVDGRAWDVDVGTPAPGLRSLLIDGVSHLVSLSGDDGRFMVGVGDELHELRVEEAGRFAIRTRGGAAGARQGQTLVAPLPGKITHVAVDPGAAVNRGDRLVVIEAMKMENEFRAAAAGTVQEVRVSVGQAVNAGD